MKSSSPPWTICKLIQTGKLSFNLPDYKHPGSIHSGTLLKFPEQYKRVKAQDFYTMQKDPDRLENADPGLCYL